MVSINRKLRLKDLEVYRFMKDEVVLSYVIIEDTRKPYTEVDKKLEPLCFLDEEDLNSIVNVFRIYLLSDEPLPKEDSILLREFFSTLVNNSSLTNFIIHEYVDHQLYEYADDDCHIETYQRMLEFVGSSYEIEAISEEQWLYLSQD